jgi:tRNA ligase
LNALYDRNNHLEQHRQALRVATASFKPPVRLLALNWALDKEPLAAVHRVCADRIQQRGTNHQTLRPDNAKAHEDVLWTFLNKAEPLALSEVDEVVDMELTDGLDGAVARAVDACVRELGLPPPAPATVLAALERARGYEPQAKRPDSPAGKKTATPRYFALLPEVALESLLTPVLADVPFWSALQGARRVVQRPHVTLVHQNSVKDKDAAEAGSLEFWERCRALHAMGGRPPLFRFRLGHVVWNERIMAITVDGVELAEEGDVGQAGAEFVAQLPDEAKRRLHITVGTQDVNVSAVEAKAMVEAWRETPSSAQSIPLADIVTTGRVKGLQM